MSTTTDPVITYALALAEAFALLAVGRHAEAALAFVEVARLGQRTAPRPLATEAPQ